MTSGTAASSHHHHHHHHSHSHETLSNPLASISTSSVQSCTELYMSNQGITKLHGFERFVNLEVLWLNGNSLTRISGLENCMRIKRLHLFDNKVTTLRNLDSLPFLEVLTLQNNNLPDLHLTLQTLQTLSHLTELDLHSNPVCEEKGYRLAVIRAVGPTLKVLDRHVITDEERKQAEEEGGGASRGTEVPQQLREQQGLTAKSSGANNGVRAKVSAKSLAAKAVIKIALGEVKKFVSLQRVLLKEHFQEADRRREGCVGVEEFRGVMELYGLVEVVRGVGEWKENDKYVSRERRGGWRAQLGARWGHVVEIHLNATNGRF